EEQDIGAEADSDQRQRSDPPSDARPPPHPPPFPILMRRGPTIPKAGNRPRSCTLPRRSVQDVIDGEVRACRSSRGAKVPLCGEKGLGNDCPRDWTDRKSTRLNSSHVSI